MPLCPLVTLLDGFEAIALAEGAGGVDVVKFVKQHSAKVMRSWGCVAGAVAV